MRALFATILSLVTACGGHLMNRRLDRIVIFITVVFIWTFISIVLFYWSFMTVGYSTTPTQIQTKLAYQTIIALSGFALIYVISAAITFFDARKYKAAAAVNELNAISVTGGLLASIQGSVVFLICLFVVYAAKYSYVFNDDDVSYGTGRIHFWESIYYGGTSRDSDLVSPPQGEGIFVGRVDYLGEGVANAKLSIELNGKYKIEELITDNKGIFRFKVPTGNWYVNQIVIYEWPNVPKDKSFTLLSGMEPPLRNASYRKHIYREQGVPIVISNQKQQDPLITVFIRDDVNVLWPAKDNYFESADLSTATIKWDAYPNAHEYLLRFKYVTRRTNNSMSYTEVAQRRVKGAELFPLAELSTKVSSSNKNEYTVEVLAFDQDRNLLGVSDRYTGRSGFAIEGGMKIFEENKRLVESAPISPESIGGFFDSSKKLKQRLDKQRDREAIEVLIEQGMYAEAEKLLSAVELSFEKHIAVMLKGYILSAQQKCVEANDKFAQANEIKGRECVPAEYRKNCAQ